MLMVMRAWLPQFPTNTPRVAFVRPPGPRIRGLNPILCPSFTPTPKDLGCAFTDLLPALKGEAFKRKCKNKKGC